MGAGLWAGPWAGLWAGPRLQGPVPRAAGSRLSFTFLPRTVTQDPRVASTGRNRAVSCCGSDPPRAEASGTGPPAPSSGSIMQD
ncbi:hypothetical protein EYF80_064742 [Liparis tanakae]|uniref:Uncharacterized protein n=1 Tax=Liparis tanakae TaxID=230148 RepID=A0A4Z2E979_9TELE|nr:hypothetical protein EYF80_064742 [Liparis tanakae]